MSVYTSTAAWKITHAAPDKKLTPVQKIVLMNLAYYADNRGENAFPSVRRIATECGLSERTAQYALRALEHANIIAVGREGGGRGRPTSYVLSVFQTVQPVAPLGRPERVQAATERVQAATERVQPVAPDPSEDPSSDPSPARARAEVGEDEIAIRLFEHYCNGDKRVGGSMRIAIAQQLEALRKSAVVPLDWFESDCMYAGEAQARDPWKYVKACLRRRVEEATPTAEEIAEAESWGKPGVVYA